MRLTLFALVAFLVIGASISDSSFIATARLDTVLPQLLPTKDEYANLNDIERLSINFSPAKKLVRPSSMVPIKQQSPVGYVSQTVQNTIEAALIPPSPVPTPLIVPTLAIAPPETRIEYQSPPVPSVPVQPVPSEPEPPVQQPPVTPPPPTPDPTPEPVPEPTPDPTPEPEPVPPPPPPPPPPSPPVIPPSFPASRAYLGIPSPSGSVPSAIMPTLPNGANMAAFPYDPLNRSTPSFTGAANQYWVDGSNSACSNVGNGSVAIPRCTLPGLSGGTWTLAGGSEVFIAGDGYPYGGNIDVDKIVFPGTASNPIWIIGMPSSQSAPRWVNQPKLNFQRLQVGDTGTLTHTLFHNVHFYNANDKFRFILSKSAAGSTGSIGYVTVRHSTCSGSGTNDPNGTIATQSVRCIQTGGRVGNEVKFIAVYDNDIFGVGRWKDDFTTSRDVHGIQPQGATYYLWYLANRSYHLQGDSIQCSNSNQWNLEHAKHPHYIYIGGNEIYENYENAYDAKGCYHVVFSENYVHDFYNAVKGANSSPIIPAQDAESNIGDRFGWFINNRLENVGDTIAYKGTAADAFVYFLGNLVVHINGGAAVPIESRCKILDDIPGCGDGMYFAQNTIDCGQRVSAVLANRNGTTLPGEIDQQISFVGNIFLGCRDGTEGSPYEFESINENWLVTHNYNVDYRSLGGPISYQAPPRMDILIGNVTNVDPEIINPTNTLSGNYRLSPSSPARNLVPEPEPYTLFRSMYGLDIRRDLDGNSWAPGATLNAGAYQ